MGQKVIDKNDPRYDPSSVIVSMDSEQFEAEHVSYGDALTLSKIRAMFARISVGEAEGQYEATEAELTMHRDEHQRLLDALKSKAGGGPVSRAAVTINVSYSELSVNPGEALPQITDTLLACRYLGSAHSHSAGSDPLKVTARFSVHRVRWHGDIFLAPSEKGGDVFAGAARFDEELSPWNTLKFNGNPFPSENAPCIVTVETSLRYATDKKKKIGRDGRKIIVRGYQSADVTFTLKMWTRPQWDAFGRMLGIIHPKLNPDRRNGHRVYSEVLDKYGIDKVYIEEIGAPTEAEPGVIQVVIKAVEVYDGDTGNVTRQIKPIAGRNVPTDQRVPLKDVSVPVVGGLAPDLGEVGTGDE